MYVNRYANDSLIGGKLLGTNSVIQKIRDGVAGGFIAADVIVLQEQSRLDTLAGRYYGDGRLWWVIAAASNIGWWLQVPYGTRLVIPTDINQVIGLI